MIKAVIVDDEPLAREGLADFVQEIDFLRLAGTCEHPLQLIKLLETTPVDLLFLDIQMPKMSGLEFLRMTKNPPMVIITSAYSDHAVEGFQLGVLDYLVKPITFDRFFVAVNKARDYQRYIQFAQSGGQGEPAVPADNFFFIKCGNKYEKIFFDDVLYIESLQNYVAIYTAREKFITLNNLKNLEQRFDPQLFIRVHKSYMVSVKKVSVIEGNELVIQHFRIPMSRSYKDQVLERIAANGVWNKK